MLKRIISMAVGALFVVTVLAQSVFAVGPFNFDLTATPAIFDPKIECTKIILGSAKDVDSVYMYVMDSYFNTYVLANNVPVSAGYSSYVWCGRAQVTGRPLKNGTYTVKAFGTKDGVMAVFDTVDVVIKSK